MISPAGYGKIYSKQAARRIRLGAAAPVRALREPPAPRKGGRAQPRRRRGWAAAQGYKYGAAGDRNGGI